MKKLFPLMFSLLVAGQVFAEESNTVVAKIAEDKVVAAATEEATVAFSALLEEGLTPAEIVKVVEEKLKEETTENEYRSILSNKRNQERLVWFLIGAMAAAGLIYVAPKCWNFVSTKLTANPEKNKGADDKSIDKTDDKSVDKTDDKSADKTDEKSVDSSGDKTEEVK